MTPDEIAAQIVGSVDIDFGGWDGCGPQPSIDTAALASAIAAALAAEREAREKAEVEVIKLRELARALRDAFAEANAAREQAEAMQRFREFYGVEGE